MYLLPVWYTPCTLPLGGSLSSPPGSVPCDLPCLQCGVLRASGSPGGLTDYTHHPWSGKSYVRQLPRTFIGQCKGGRHWQPPLIWERRTLARMERLQGGPLAHWEAECERDGLD